MKSNLQKKVTRTKYFKQPIKSDPLIPKQPINADILKKPIDFDMSKQRESILLGLQKVSRMPWSGEVCEALADMMALRSMVCVVPESSGLPRTAVIQ